MSGCLTEETVAELVEGRLEGDRFDSAEAHVAGCPGCMRLVVAAGGAARTSDAPPSSLTVPAPLVRGARVGRYEIREPVGAGAMGRVYSARDPVLDRRVALKLLHPRTATEELESRLLREAKAMARLSHPEVIGIYDAGRFEDQLFIAMEFVEGKTLRQWLEAERRPWREVLAVFLRAGRGLARAHEAGIIHRDFKPDNVLVGDDGRVRVSDFGLARAAQSPESTAAPASSSRSRSVSDATLTRTGTLLGTPSYMAPEQYVGAQADERADVYAFCVALYEGLYGVRPFRRLTLLELAAEKRDGHVAAPADDCGVPTRLRRAVLVGLRPAPGDRYASMNELLDALVRAARPLHGRVAAVVVVALAGVAAAVLLVQATTGQGSRPGVSAANVSVAPIGCASNAECVGKHGGEPFACRRSDGACVPMASADCTPMFEPDDLAAPDTVWLGAMLPARGSPGDAGDTELDAADMARRELAAATSARVSSGEGPRVRPIALVACDDRVDATRAARHLADDVGVPAILGFGPDRELIELASTLLIPRRILSIATRTASPLVTQVSQPAELPRMVWRTTYSLEAVADATAFFIRDAFDPGTELSSKHVMLVRDDEPTVLPYAQKLFRRLTRRAGVPLKDAADYKEVAVPAVPTKQELDRAATAVVAGKPTFVVLVGQPDNALSIVQRVEGRWPAGSPAPVYLLAGGSAATLGPVIGTSAGRRHRVFAVSAEPGPKTRTELTPRFALDGGPPAPVESAGTYDAFYLLAYAVLSLGDRAVDGAAIGTAMSRLLPPGRAIHTGPADVTAALTALASGENVDLTGASGSLDFDPATGECSPRFRLMCPALDPHGRVAAQDADSSVFFLPRSHKVQGVIACP